jgi:glycosyltransferase involved in cell wall biosynthesis
VRILFVIPEFPPHRAGGIARHYALLAGALAEAGATVSVLVTSPFSEFSAYVTAAGVPVSFVALSAVERHAARLPHLGAAPLFRRWIAAGLAAGEIVAANGQAFDIIETTDFGLIFPALLALRNRPPVVVKMHGSLGQISEYQPVPPHSSLDYALARVTEESLLPLAEGLHAYSPANAEEWAARLGTAVDFIDPPLTLPEAIERTPSEFSGLVTGRVQTWKGPDVLCRAIEGLQQRAPDDMKIAWVGRDTMSAPDGGSLSAWLSQRYPAIWGSRVVPIGEEPFDAVERRRASVRYVVVPSLWDTFNYTLAESMAAANVVVGSTGAGASYLIDPGVNGFACAAGDAEALGETLLEAHHTGPDRRTNIGHCARETIAHHLAPDIVAANTLAAMQRAVSRGKQVRQPGPWLREFYMPSNEVASGQAFLENVAITDLTRHLGQRLARKVFK